MSLPSRAARWSSWARIWSSSARGMKWWTVTPRGAGTSGLAWRKAASWIRPWTRAVRSPVIVDLLSVGAQGAEQGGGELAGDAQAGAQQIAGDGLAMLG